MSETDEIFETSSISSKTIKATRFGGRHSKQDGRRQRIIDDDPWPSSLLEWDNKRGRPDGEKSSLQREEILTSSASSRRMSDLSNASHEGDARSTSSSHSERRIKNSPEILPMLSSGGLRARPSASFFHDDFNETMEKMIQEFDAKCSRSIWDNDDGLFSRRGLENDNDFFSGLSTRSIFQRKRKPPPLFHTSFKDMWPEQKSSFDEDYAESGVFSDEGSSRPDNRSEDVEKSDNLLRQKYHVAPENFAVDIDVQGFKANELLVRTEGRRVIICAKTKKDPGEQGKSSREFKREFDLPEGVNPYEVISNLMPDGYLRIEAPVKKHQQIPKDNLTRDMDSPLESDAAGSGTG